ncbi:Fpg/Nei family DNA glycosylase [Cellulomonas marina]|uniref:DNA-(apurinic or apyrimidinic site) lyase n=1 Tax=Cellulomonas marina TaxID=988821 RepID=A0A1I0Y0C2_9CELL|nr:DNA-formamidopyrimidine glycosylase family protein [Cellulomonas marina]GIG28450.1 formamidopyrimidine-DNA glycosylase [Cellulomonas marina]SFB06086.1 endonuclease-8 [Cellulomonas marina]
MPEGHTVHRAALQLAQDLVGRPVAVSSPQGRFAAGAERLDGRVAERADAVGKHLFLSFEGDAVLHVHLGLYGRWDLAGRVSRLRADALEDPAAFADRPVPASASSGGAGRGGSRHVRLGEREVEDRGDAEGEEPFDGPTFPPDPVGQVRVRLLTEHTVADLRGPTACEVLDPEGAAAVVARLGPDPVVGDELRQRLGGAPATRSPADEAVHRITRRSVPVGQLLMDQAVVAGVGNIYRAELLFRARLDPWTPGKEVPAKTARALWEDWDTLLRDGIRTGMMITREDLDAEGRAAARRDRSQRHHVYHRQGQPCLVCGTPVVIETMQARNLFRCPWCQVRPGTRRRARRAPR